AVEDREVRAASRPPQSPRTTGCPLAATRAALPPACSTCSGGCNDPSPRSAGTRYSGRSDPGGPACSCRYLGRSRLHPFGAPVVVRLALPDRHSTLDLVQGPAAGVERGAAVSVRCHDDDRCITHSEAPCAVLRFHHCPESRRGFRQNVGHL